jgi:hypothetical protein
LQELANSLTPRDLVSRLFHEAADAAGTEWSRQFEALGLNPE